VLPLRASEPLVKPREALTALDVEPPEAEQERAAWRARLAERWMQEAHLALEAAEQQGAPLRDVERAAAVCAQAVAVYEAAEAATSPTR
jgi:hypothetical protein